jgi:hypothetical protein
MGRKRGVARKLVRAVVELVERVHREGVRDLEVGRQVPGVEEHLVAPQARNLLEGRAIPFLVESRDLEPAVDHRSLPDAGVEADGARGAVGLGDEADRAQALVVQGVRDLVESGPRADVVGIEAVDLSLEDGGCVVAEALVIEVDGQREEATRREHQARAAVADALVHLAGDSPPQDVPRWDGIDPVGEAEQVAHLALALALLVAPPDGDLGEEAAHEPLLSCEELPGTGS